MYINVSSVKDLCHKHGRRAGKDFLRALDSFVRSKIETACGIHNGGKKTLDLDVAEYSGIRTDE